MGTLAGLFLENFHEYYRDDYCEYQAGYYPEKKLDKLHHGVLCVFFKNSYSYGYLSLPFIRVTNRFY